MILLTCYRWISFLPLQKSKEFLQDSSATKSPGEDLLTADLLQAGGTEVARWILPLVVKCFATGQLPLVFQGATLIPLYKGKHGLDTLDSGTPFLLERLAKESETHLGVFQQSGQ